MTAADVGSRVRQRGTTQALKGDKKITSLLLQAWESIPLP